MTASRVLAALGILLSVGCGRSSSSTGTGGSAGVPGTGGVGGGTGGSGKGSGGVGSGGKGSGGTAGKGSGGTAGGIGEAGAAGIPEACVPGSPPSVPMRKLTRFQLDGVFRDVFGDASRPAQRLVPYDTGWQLASDGVPSPDWVAGMHELAHDVAVEATRTNAALSATLGCDPSVEDEPACTERLRDGLLPRLLRRPLTTEDVEEYDASFAAGLSAGGDFASGVRMVLEVVLQSPDFLYRVEVGEPLDVPSSSPRAGWRALTPVEMASRLSLLLWGSVPDDTLMGDAAAGRLRTKEEVRAAATLMLGDPRVSDVVGYFHTRVLGLLDHSMGAAGVPDNPDFTPEIASLMKSETAAFLGDIAAAGPGGFELLFTAPYTYVNEPLAAFYGIPDVVGPELRKVSLLSPPYSGILTQGSFLATHAAPTESVPPLRGAALLQAFQCLSLQIPSDVPQALPPDLAEGLTTRERYAASAASDPICAGCHSILDPAGFALEHFDQTGRYRETELGKPIDAATEVTIGDEAYPVNGAAELGQLLAESPDVRSCYLSHWAAYAYGATAEAPLDDCSRAQLEDAFERSNGDLRALLLELTQTDAFFYLPPGGP